VIAYDGDEAGRNATLRAAPILLAAGLDIFALDLGGEKDPDSLIQRQGADRFLEVLSQASDIFTFALTQWGGDVAGLSGREKADRVEQFVPLLSAVNDPVVRNDAAQRIADAFRLEFETVWSRVRGKAQTGLVERQTPGRESSADKSVLIAAIQGKLPPERLAWLRADFFNDPACKTLFSIMKNDLVSGSPIDFTEIATEIRGEAELTLLSELTLSEDVDEESLKRIDENLQRLEARYVKRRKLEIQREIVEAEKAGDAARVAELDAEKQELSRMSSALK
jgi:DNA primase